MFTSMSKLDFLDAGSLGIFYPWPGTEAPDDEHKERGWIARSGDWVHIDALEERDPPGVMLNGRFDDDTFPAALVGRLPTTTVVALELLPRGHTMVFGPNASTRRYRARTVVARVPLHRLHSSRLKSLSSEYLGLSHWFGMQAGNETWTQAEDGTIQAFELKVGTPVPDSIASLPGGRSLVLSSKWSVAGPDDDRRVSIPMAVRIESTRPAQVFKLLEPLIHTQNLISLLCSGFVAATSASARLDLNASEEREPRDPTLPCWSGPLFHCPDGVAPAVKTTEVRRSLVLETVGERPKCTVHTGSGLVRSRHYEDAGTGELPIVLPAEPAEGTNYRFGSVLECEDHSPRVEPSQLVEQ